MRSIQRLIEMKTYMEVDPPNSSLNPADNDKQHDPPPTTNGTVESKMDPPEEDEAPKFVKSSLADLIDTSLRSLQSASSMLHMTFSKPSGESFVITPKDLNELCSERTAQALARLLSKAVKGTKDVDISVDGEQNGDLEESKSNQRQIESLIKRIGIDDAHTDNGHKDSSKNVDEQGLFDMEMAANALSTVLLKSKPDEGLSPTAENLANRRAVFGSNAIAEKKLDSFLKLCWNAVQDFVLLMLIALGVIGILVETTIGLEEGEQCGHCWLEGAAILTSVCIVVLVTAGIDYAKQFAFVRLTKSLNESNTKMVIRDGHVVTVTDEEIVVGDILTVNSHNLASIPADCVVLGPSSSSSGLKMDESALTGESVLISKHPGDIVLSGTTVIQGSAKMVVVAVGTNSVAGKIQAHVYESSDHENDLEGDEESPLFVKLEKIAKQIGIAGTCAAALSLGVNCIKGFAFGDEDPKEALIEYFVTAITVLAVAVPEGLPLAVTLSLAYSSNKMMKEQNLVKHLDACETMGCATTICTDKVR